MFVWHTSEVDEAADRPHGCEAVASERHREFTAKPATTILSQAAVLTLATGRRPSLLLRLRASR